LGGAILEGGAPRFPICRRGGVAVDGNRTPLNIDELDVAYPSVYQVLIGRNLVLIELRGGGGRHDLRVIALDRLNLSLVDLLNHLLDGLLGRGVGRRSRRGGRCRR